MSAVNFRSKLFSLLARELESFIPQFKPYTLDYQVVIYASKDLETWLKVKMNTDDSRTVYGKLEEWFRSNPEDLRVSVNFWAGMWLKKWRERVRVLPTKVEMPQDYAERMKRARSVFQELEYKSDLRSMAVKKLIAQGEICMTEFIADNLIIEEIARRLQKDGKNNIVLLDPLHIYNSVISRIVRLSKERGALVYLNIKPNAFQY